MSTTRYILQSYYLATPLFFLIDVIFGINIRVSFLGAFPILKYLYYGFSFTCGIYIYRVPRNTAFVAFVESSVNIALIIISFFKTYYVLVPLMLQGDSPADNIITPGKVLNFAISALIFYFAFHSNLNKVNEEIKARLRP